MSFAADVYKITAEGDKIANFLESDLTDPNLKELLDTYRELFTVTEETVYDTLAVKEQLKKQYTIEMSGSYVHEDGWSVWVKEQDGPIVIPLSDIPSSIENNYVLHGTRIQCISSEPVKYNSWVRKNNLQYIINDSDWVTALSFFPKNSSIRKLENSDLVIVNSY